MAAPNKEELIQIETFRKRVQDVLTNEESKSDHYLCRWMRARGHNLDKAEELLRNHLTWRKENNADNALEAEYDSFFSKNYPYFIRGCSREGHPVLELPVGRWDVRLAIARPNGEKEFMDYSTQMFERLLDKIRENNCMEKNSNRSWPITQIIVIGDWNQYSYTQLCNWKAIQALISLASKYESHYPEILFRGYFINCPSWFPLIFALIKPLITSATLEKLSIFGCNRDEWEPVVREFIDPSQLAVEFGGE